MTTLPAGGYFTDSTRKNQGAKQGLDAVLAVVRELPGGRAAVVAEIQGGAIEADTALVLLETEGQSSADALVVIATTHHPEGRLLLLRPATSGRTITVRHAFQGDGAIHLRDETDLVLDATSRWLLLYRDELDWREIARFGFAGGGGAGGGEGEANTGANVNADGIGVFEAKVGAQLRFRGIGSTADGKVTVTYDADAKVIRLTVDESALEVPAENVQGLAEVATSGDSDDLAEGATHLLLTPAERAKLAGIEPGAEVNAVASVFGRTGAVLRRPHQHPRLCDPIPERLRAALVRGRISLLDRAEPSTLANLIDLCRWSVPRAGLDPITSNPEKLVACSPLVTAILRPTQLSGAAGVQPSYSRMYRPPL